MAPIGGARLIQVFSPPPPPAVLASEMKVLLGGKDVLVNATIDGAFAAALTVPLFSILYSAVPKTHTLVLSRWAGAGLAEFLLLFHQHCARDAGTFGVVVHSTSGDVVRMTYLQQLAAVKQGCEDVLGCVERLDSEHGDCMLTVARKHCLAAADTSPTTYADFIESITCEAIVNARLTTRDASAVSPVELPV